MLITYLTILVGLWVLRIEHAPVVALFIAILDMLPVIGVGTVLVPWGIFEIATANRFLGIGLILLFVVNTVIRQFTEPRIVGKSLNLHPLITLMAIYIGYALFGIIGIFVLPVIAVSISAILKRDNSTEIA
jgi:predicted PurR-regulated permease PerM